MTREEAICHIKDVICENNTIKPNIVVFEQEKEALYMAIEALEQERSRLAQITQYRNDCEKLMQENEQLKKALEQEPCEDCISRQEVLNQIFYSTDNSGDVVLGSVLRRRVENLPSVKPQEPYFWEKCPYYEPDIMFDEKDEYDMGKCTYKQEPFDIETYCKEHFVVMVDKDVWEKLKR